jgi:RNA polymerase sigma-70 factor (ECF subfamily)
MPERTASDDELLRAVPEGNEAAFAELMRRHRTWVRSLIATIVREEELAEDLTQEAFCRVYRSVGSYDSRGAFVPWLKRIAVNLAKDALRTRKGPILVPLEEAKDLPETDHEADPLAVFSSSVLRKELRAALDALPDEQRLVLAMYYFEGMSLKEVAGAMQCPVGTVKSRLFNGLRRVRRTLMQTPKGELVP